MLTSPVLSGGDAEKPTAAASPDSVSRRECRLAR
jgi:hypothetical protein